MTRTSDTELDSETAEKAARLQRGGVRRSPALFQEGAEIGPNTYLRVLTVVGLDVHVRHGVEVKNSVLMTDASVGHFSYIGDSVLGRGVNFGAGTNVANLRHDDANVRVTVEGDRVDTGRRNLGAIVGDGAKAGINTPLNAGLKLGAGTTIAPGESVLRDRLLD